MSTEISIRVPKVIATPAEFAEWEGYSRGSVYQMIHNGKLANFMIIRFPNIHTLTKPAGLSHYVTTWRSWQNAPE